MGCWHGCGPVHCAPAPRGWYGPADEDVSYQDVPRPPRRRGGPEGRDMRAASLEERLDALREELRRVEADLAELGRQG